MREKHEVAEMLSKALQAYDDDAKPVISGVVAALEWCLRETETDPVEG
jgi:hypothetical protein